MKCSLISVIALTAIVFSCKDAKNRGGATPVAEPPPPVVVSPAPSPAPSPTPSPSPLVRAIPVPAGMLPGLPPGVCTGTTASSKFRITCQSGITDLPIEREFVVASNFDPVSHCHFNQEVVSCLAGSGDMFDIKLSGSIEQRINFGVEVLDSAASTLFKSSKRKPLYTGVIKFIDDNRIAILRGQDRDALAKNFASMIKTAFDAIVDDDADKISTAQQEQIETSAKATLEYIAASRLSNSLKVTSLSQQLFELLPMLPSESTANADILLKIFDLLATFGFGD